MILMSKISFALLTIQVSFLCLILLIRSKDKYYLKPSQATIVVLQSAFLNSAEASTQSGLAGCVTGALPLFPFQSP